MLSFQEYLAGTPKAKKDHDVDIAGSWSNTVIFFVFKWLH